MLVSVSSPCAQDGSGKGLEEGLVGSGAGGKPAGMGLVPASWSTGGAGFRGEPRGHTWVLPPSRSVASGFERCR